MFLKLLILSLSLVQIRGQYEATWDSIDSRPLPDWYDKAKIGIFLHWGVYSVPSFGSEWFWVSLVLEDDDYVNFMKNNYPPNFTYQDFAKDFTAEFFDPQHWAYIFAKSGAKYVVLTSKHHEGYTLWPSKFSYSWNAMDVGPKRDLVGELAAAVRETDVRFGVYHSLLEWFHPIYQEDRSNNWTTSTFVDTKIIPELKELVNNYKPELIWSDGEWEAPGDYWKSAEFLAWLYNESPVKDTVVTNDRWGQDITCNHGGYLTCSDRYIPDEPQARKWENAMTIDKESWGFRRNAALDAYFTIEELLENLVQTISKGGNIIINVGPTKEGTIVPIFQERLLQLGEWLSINGEAIYETQPWAVQNDRLATYVWYTMTETAVYAILLEWPEDDTVILGSAAISEPVTISLLGNEDLEIGLGVNDGMPVLRLPRKSLVVSEWAWVLKFTN